MYSLTYTVKKEKKIFLIYKKIQNGWGAKLFIRMGFLIYEEISEYKSYMGRPLVIYDFAPGPISKFPNI